VAGESSSAMITTGFVIEIEWQTNSTTQAHTFSINESYTANCET
jgi:hypothetical protein